MKISNKNKARILKIIIELEEINEDIVKENDRDRGLLEIETFTEHILQIINS